MKMLAGFVAAVVLALAGHARAADDEKPVAKKFPDTIKLNLEPLDKAFSVKLKSAVVKEEETTHTSKTDIILTLEFTKDLTDLRPLAFAFTPAAGVPFRFNEVPLYFTLYDEENVLIARLVITGGEGDLSGVKGEAFRILFSVPPETFKRTKRIETRLFDFLKQAPKQP